MDSSYHYHIDQTFDFPQEGFSVSDNRLFFHGIDLMQIIGQYGTPLKLTYLPKISEQIVDARDYFENAMQKCGYNGSYTYCYCTKSSHFSFVLDEVLKNDVHLETSSAFDIYLLRKLIDKGLIGKHTFLIHNGYKKELYTRLIAELINDGYNSIPVLDNMNELEQLRPLVHRPCHIGIRIATSEEPRSDYYSARLGIRHREIENYYLKCLKDEKIFKLKMLHFFIDSGIEDSSFYRNELMQCLKVYCTLKRICPSLDSLNIGGGFPVRQSLADSYDYQELADLVIRQIKDFCDDQHVAVPNIFTEFGSYTVANSGVAIYSVIDQKKQNDVECWNMIDSSFITTLPDSWAINKRFILMAINNWHLPIERVNLGGLTCDSQDYYNVESHESNIYLPVFHRDTPLYIGFFNTGAYQSALGGYGGIQHCLVPSPRQVIVHRKPDGSIVSELFAKEQEHEDMLKLLGY